MKKEGENSVTELSPAGFFSADEELRAIGVGPCIGHGQNATSCVLQSKVLICKLVAVDRLSTSSVVVCKVATLESQQQSQFINHVV